MTERFLRFAILVALTTAVPLMAKLQSPVVPHVPDPQSRRWWNEEPEPLDGKLEIAARTFFTFLSYPNPQFRGVVAVTDGTRLIWVKPSGLATIVPGEKMRFFLLSLFSPEEKVEVRYENPVIWVEGPFGRVSRKFSMQEAGKKPECVTFYAEAIHQSKTGWQFTQITFVSADRFAPCRIEQP